MRAARFTLSDRRRVIPVLQPRRDASTPQPPGPTAPDRPLRPGAPVPVAALAGTRTRPPNLLPYPYLSIGERDRRWGRLREAMDRLNLEAVILPPSLPDSPALHADLRWLTQFGGLPDAPVAAVFPRRGEPVVIADDAVQWLECQPWITDLREAAGAFPDAVRVVMRQHGLQRGRVGVARLGQWPPGWEIETSQTFISKLAASCPSIEWIDFSEPLTELRLAKSAEEIAFLERAAAILDEALLATARAIRPEVSGTEVWGTLVEEICRRGSDLPRPPRWTAGTAPGSLRCRPEREPIGPGWLVLTDAEVSWGGYRARGSQTLGCEPTDPATRELMAVLVDGWRAAVGTLRPGLRLRNVATRMLAEVERTTPAPWRTAQWGLALRGCGLGEDPPQRSGGQIRQEDLERTVGPGWCLAVTLSLTHGGRRLIWGDPVTVSAEGARRIGRRPMQVLSAASDTRPGEGSSQDR